MKLRTLYLCLLISFFSFEILFFSNSDVYAAASFGLGVGKVNSEQTDVNNLRSNANDRAGGIPAGSLDSGYEATAWFQYRFDGTPFAIQIRPSYFMQKEDGSGGDGSYAGTYKYATTGMTTAFLMKLYPLENQNLRLFFQTGVLWGKLETEIQEVNYKVTADGSNLGYQAGLGVEFNFAPHSIILEGGFRVLYIERNIVNSTSGTPDATSISQTDLGRELEFRGNDLQTNMSGLQAMIGYQFTF